MLASSKSLVVPPGFTGAIHSGYNSIQHATCQSKSEVIEGTRSMSSDRLGEARGAAAYPPAARPAGFGVAAAGRVVR